MLPFVAFLSLFALSNAAVLPRIIGGTNTTIDKVPWEVILDNIGMLHCAGSIISKNYILTTASCTNHLGPMDLTVRSGTSYLSETGIETEIEEMTAHPDFNTNDFDYDVAILKLKTPLNFTETQKAISLSLNVPKVNTTAIIAGWGTGGPGTGFSEIIKWTKVPIVDQDDCTAAYSPYRKVTERMICAGAVGKDVCTADGGAPLVINNVQFGIASWGNGCGLEGFPGVYTVPGAVKDFIDQNSNNEAKWV